MSWLVRLFARRPAEAGERQHLQLSQPVPPPGFVRRSDPNFYFLARKF